MNTAYCIRSLVFRGPLAKTMVLNSTDARRSDIFMQIIDQLILSLLTQFEFRKLIFLWKTKSRIPLRFHHHDLRSDTIGRMLNTMLCHRLITSSLCFISFMQNIPLNDVIKRKSSLNEGKLFLRRSHASLLSEKTIYCMFSWHAALILEKRDQFRW